MSDIEREIAKRVDAFVAEISVLLRKAALQQASEILAEQAAAAGGASAAPGRKRGRKAAPRSAGGRRSPEQLEAQMTVLADAIDAGPGRRIEEIAEELGESTKELTLPIRKLLDTKRIRRKGQRRATRYYPAGKKK